MKRIISLVMLCLVFIVACSFQQPYQPTKTDFEVSGDLKRFNSSNDIVEFLESVENLEPTLNYFSRGAGMQVMTMAESADLAMAKSGSAEEFSTTNVQVEGVDEADFVKNDGKFIYVITGNKLVIVDAYPAQDAEILSEIEIKGTASNMFINDDRLVLFTSTNEETFLFAHFNIIPRPYYRPKSHALLYDVSNRKEPKLIKDYELKGNYLSSRMIGDYVYLIVQDHVYYQNRLIDLPTIRESSKIILKPDIFYFDNPETNYNFNTVMSFNIKTGEEPKAKTFMMGYGNTIYMSRDNLYIAYQKNPPYRYYYDQYEEIFYKVVVPLLPSSVKGKINDIKNNDELSSYEKWEQISSIIEDMYNEMDEKEKEVFIDKVNEEVTAYKIKQEIEHRKTVIHRIKIEDGNIKYEAKGQVPGYLLNQFSMDEHDDYFRVATTMQAWARGQSILYNNVYILDREMNVVGKLEDIAPDEAIYSTRFMGDKLYMVTFKRIDPFFVIDLSNPKKPKILGKLKLPGFSDYLHPYDENHIIGVGKETGESDWGGVETKGVKIALFDVSDVENPKLIDKYEIGARGSDSQALNDHKAFLFDRNKNLLAIPVREVKSDRIYDEKYGYYKWDVWQGAYVFTVTEEGFILKGKISHEEDKESTTWYSSPSAVRRSLYIDNIIYTISLKKIMMNDLDSLEEINELTLPYEESRQYPYPVIMEEVVR